MIFKPTEELKAINEVKSILNNNRSVKIEKVTRSKSLEQNAYLWLVFTFIGQEVGTDKTDIYLFYLQKYPKFKEVINPGGYMSFVALTLSQFNSDQTRVFIDEVVTDARIEGFDVPDCKDKKAIDMYNYYKQKGLL